MEQFSLLGCGCMLQLYCWHSWFGFIFIKVNVYADIAGDVHMGTTNDDEGAAISFRSPCMDSYGRLSGHVDKFIKSLNFHSCVLNPCW